MQGTAQWDPAAVFSCERRISDVPLCPDLCGEISASHRMQIPVLFPVLSQTALVSQGYRGGLDYICRSGTEVTLDKILDRSGIPEKEKEITLRLLGMTEQRKEPVPYPCLKEIRQKLEGCPFFLKAMEINSREKLPGLFGVSGTGGAYGGKLHGSGRQRMDRVHAERDLPCPQNPGKKGESDRILLGAL